MKCFRRSTRLFANTAIAVLLATASVVATELEAGAPSEVVVATAIARAVQVRVGRDVSVSVWKVTQLRLADRVQTLIAIPDRSARIGAPARFVLNSQARGQRPVRVGEATAIVQAVAPAVRTTREISRGATLAAEDVAVVATDMSGRLLRPLPSLENAVGARAIRDMETHAVIAHTDIAAEPLVRAGDIVRAHARVGDVEVTGDLVAAESGLNDEIIRVVNRDSRRVLRARVLDRGEVEIVNVR